MLLGEELFTLLRSTLKKMHQILEKELMPHGISHAEARLLIMIDETGGSSQEELISKVEVDRSNVGRALKKLENLRYLKRSKIAIDKRAYEVYLTPQGIEVKKLIIEIKRNFEETFTKGASEDEILTLIDLLKKTENRINEKNYISVKESKQK